MKNLLLLCLLITSVAFAETKNKKTEKDYWEETNLDFSAAQVAINQKDCVASDKAYLACFAALDVLERLSSNKSGLVPEAFYNTHVSDYDGVLANYSPLILAKLKKRAPINNLADWKKSKKFEEEVQAAVLATKTSNNKVNFDLILADLARNASYTVKAQSQIAAALNSFLSVYYDPHTHIDPAAYIQQQYNNVDESIVGIGTKVKDLKGRILVDKVIAGGPADAAGVKSGDIIFQIEGVATEKMTLDEAVSLLRGKENTIVNLSVLRGAAPLQFKITRAAVVFPNVTVSVFEDQNTKVGYIKLNSFMEKNACSKISTAIEGLEKQNVQGLVFDLRGNGGGLLDQAVCIVGLFVGKDKVAVKVKDLNSNTFTDYETGYNLAGAPVYNFPSTSLPMITLIDSGSASASEVVAGALQDHNRSWIAGDRSFGKGSVQQVMGFNITNVPGEVVIARTIQRFYQPLGGTNQMVGIIPEFSIPPKLNATPEELFTLREEDLYSNALVAVNPPHVVTRPTEVATINSCVTGVAGASSTVDKDEDYQLYSVGKIMTCSLQKGISIQRR